MVIIVTRELLDNSASPSWIRHWWHGTLVTRPSWAGFVSVSFNWDILLEFFFFYCALSFRLYSYSGFLEQFWLSDNILTDTYLSRIKPDSGSAEGDLSRLHNINDNGFPSNVNSFGNQLLAKEESLSFSTASEQSRLADPRLEGSKKSMGSVTALKELVRY